MLTLAAFVVGASAFADKPVSGKYYISNVSTGKYVKVYKKYYAKPDVSSTSDATKLTVGIGAKDIYGVYAEEHEGYKLYSLAGDYSGGTAEVFDYIDKAVKLAKELSEEKLRGKLDELDEVSGSIDIDEEALDSLISTFNTAMDMYKTDYCYFVVEPVQQAGTTSVVRLRAEIPAVPNAVNFAAKALTSGHKDAWTWAKEHVKSYINNHTNSDNAEVKTMADKYLDEIEPGNTYYLIGQSDNTFDFCLASEVDAKGALAYWKMELQEETKDGLTPGTYQIQNNSTELFVEVTDKYKAAPDVTEEDAAKFSMLPSTMITVDFGRVDRNNENLYQITTLQNQDQDVCAYIAKGVSEAKNFAKDKMSAKKETIQDYLDKVNRKVNEKLYDVEGDSLVYTFEELEKDVELAANLYAEAYGNMKLLDNGDGTVSLFVAVPQVPELVKDVWKYYKGDDEADPWEWLKEQMVTYFETHAENITPEFVSRNLEKVNPGDVKYLAADSENTFDMLDGVEALSKWNLEVPSFEGYFRVKNVGTENYVNVSSYDGVTVDAKDPTAAGQVFYVRVGDDGTGGINVKELRAQGLGMGSDLQGYSDTEIGATTASVAPVKFSTALTGVIDNELQDVDLSAYGVTDAMVDSVKKNWDKSIYLKATTTEDDEVAFYAYTSVGKDFIGNVYEIDKDGDLYVCKEASLESKGDNALWQFEEVDSVAPFNVNFAIQGQDGNYYASVCYDFDFELADGMKAYAVTGQSEEPSDYTINGKTYSLFTAEVETLEGKLVPAGTPIIIESADAAALLLPTTESESAEVSASGSMLHGVLFPQDLSDLFTLYDNDGTENSIDPYGIYAFGKDESMGDFSVGFWSMTTEIQKAYSYTYPANRAFIYIPSTEKAKGLVLISKKSDTTGISQVLSEAGINVVSGDCYDLQGRKVVRPVKGVYIMDGKKMVVK